MRDQMVMQAKAVGVIRMFEFDMSFLNFGNKNFELFR